VLFLDAIYLPVRPSGPKEGVMCAWGFTEDGERALVCVRLGACEAKDDWLELGRDLSGRGLQAPRLIVADGAPGLTLAIEELWPRADRQHCAVHRLRNLQAKLHKSDHERVRLAYWKALNEATGVKDGKLRLQVLISELKHAGYESASRCLADDLDALVVHLRYPLRHRNRWRSKQLQAIEHRRAQLMQSRKRQFPFRLHADRTDGPQIRRRLDRVLQQSRLPNPRLAARGEQRSFLALP
jgi:transposase-like protein